MIGLIAIAASPLFKLADTPPHPTANRITTIDGLRGFLALSVVFHHGVIYHGYMLTGVWAPPPSHFYSVLGPFGVDVFFMITGYLFWSIMIKTAGAPGWQKLYFGRVFRIGPVYLLAIAAMVVTIFARTGFVLHVPALSLIRSLAPAAMLGIFFPFGPINGDQNPSVLLAQVTWTLQAEWCFYFSLFLIGRAAKHKFIYLIYPMAALVFLLAYIARHANGPPMIADSTPICAALFLIGIICASLQAQGWTIRLPNKISSTLILALLISLFSVCHTIFSASALILLGAIFFLVISGCDVFGLLATRAAIRLGNISYGIYLLQGLVFTWVFAMPVARDLAIASPTGHWLVLLICSILLLAFALLAHKLIEQPGIRLGQTAASLLSRRVHNRAAARHDMPKKTA